MHVIVVGLNHKTAPVETREQFSIDESKLPEAITSLRSTTQIPECVILCTCNRTEVYISSSSPGAGNEVTVWLGSYCGLSDELHKSFYLLQDQDAVHHLFSVASGLDSMVVGEDQILGQVKDAYVIARETGSTGPVLNRLFHRAISVGKRVRTETAISRGAFSVGSSAIRLAESIFEDLRGCSVLVLGAGEMAEQVMAHLVRAGAGSVAVVNRSEQRATDLARGFGASTYDFDRLEEALTLADIVITSTSAREYIVTRDMLGCVLGARRGKPIFVIDIAVPRNVDPSAADIDGVFLYNIDDLRAVVERDKIARKKEIERAQGIVEQETCQFVGEMRILDAVPLITAIRDKFETIRQA
ncbi:MAG: glutamyl-tRNA reductase, partial [Armatimonadota bacterium]